MAAKPQTLRTLVHRARWRVTNGTIDLQHFATEADADRGREAIGRQDMLCYVETRTPSPGDVTADITYTFNSGD